MTDWKRAAEVFEALAQAAHHKDASEAWNVNACEDSSCKEIVGFISALRAGGPPPDAVTRALEAIVSASSAGKAEMPDALLVAAQNALGDAGRADWIEALEGFLEEHHKRRTEQPRCSCGLCDFARETIRGTQHVLEGARKLRDFERTVCEPCAADAHEECEGSANEPACGCDAIHPPPEAPPRWTGTPMTTHAACLPGEGCRVETGMRFEAAMRFMVEGVKTMPDEVAAMFAVQRADALIAELAKAKP